MVAAGRLGRKTGQGVYTYRAAPSHLFPHAQRNRAAPLGGLRAAIFLGRGIPCSLWNIQTKTAASAFTASASSYVFHSIYNSLRKQRQSHVSSAGIWQSNCTQFN